jgi:aminomethyltransferase
VVDDLIAYLYSDDHVFLIPNAANTADVVARLAAAAPPGIEVSNEHEAYAVLAVQGPRSADVLARMDLPYDHEYMSFEAAGGMTVCRTGYTGEHGYELVVPSERAGAVWDAIMADGQVRPCGLAARDTLRTEMGYPLHGHELSLDISPLQARAGWAVGWAKPRFWGREALLAEREAGPRRLLWGLESLDRGIPRPQMRVLANDAPVGEVTSGTFSPTKRIGIGLALIDAGTAGEGDQVEVDVRGRRSPMAVVKPPFVQPSVR